MAKMKSWNSTPVSLTLKGAGKAREFAMKNGDDVCGLLKDYALWMAAKASGKKKKDTKH
eukprot:SAG22_NODE_4460_length_1261_cov_1.606713_2_plen_59_part_00